MKYEYQFHIYVPITVEEMAHVKPCEINCVIFT